VILHVSFRISRVLLGVRNLARYTENRSRGPTHSLSKPWSSKQGPKSLQVQQIERMFGRLIHGICFPRLLQASQRRKSFAFACRARKRGYSFLQVKPRHAEASGLSLRMSNILKWCSLGSVVRYSRCLSESGGTIWIH
jgi:hypothetical protein